MITTYKQKAYDAAQDINGLKDQLGSVLKEISAFGSRLEETKALQLHAEEYGFARSFSYEERLRDLKLKLQPGREPAKPVIFLTRMVVESLSRGPMSEKDIKTIVLDRCKELGIKSSNRGLIAGTGMDVATVCSVLAALGAIEATAPPDPKAAENAGNAIDTTSGPISSGYASASSATDTINGVGSGVYSVLTDRWQSRLSEYIQDALQSKAAMLLEADAMSSGAGINSAGGSGIGKVFSNNTSANTSAGVTPSASSNNIASMVSPVNTSINTSSVATGTTSNATTINTINSTTYNNTAPTNASLNNTNVVNTASTSTNNTNANNTAVMSNTARLIAEYHSRNGTDPNAITNTINTNTANPSTLNTINSTISTTVNPSSINTSSTLPVYNSTKGTKSIQSYYTPLNGSTNVNNVNSTMSSVGINGTNVGIVGGIGSVGQTLANNIVQNTPSTISTQPMTSITNTIGYRAPLAADAIDANTSNSISTGVANINTTNTSLKAPYTLPTYTSSVQYNHTLSQATNNTPNTTQAPTSLPVPTLTTHSTLPTTYTTSNPATTPATVGFLSVTHPSNKLVLPSMSADGTLSHSTSLSNVGSGMSGVSIGGGIGGSIGGGIGGNIGVNSNGMSGSMSSGVVGMNGINTTSTIGINNTINPLNTTMNTTMNPGMNNMQYNVPMVHNTMPIVPNLMNMNSYPTNTALPTFVTNTTNSYNNLTPYNPNNTYPNTYNNTLPNSTMNTTMALNTTNNTNTTNAKAKAPKPPKPPAEKKLSKKAAAAAAKLLETNNTNIGNTNIGSSAGGNGSVAGSVVGGSASSSVTGAVNANKARRGPSALRVWKLREEYVLIDVSSSSSSSSSSSGDVKPVIHQASSAVSSTTSNTTNAALSLLLDPSLLHTAATTHYTLSSTQELEERILRRIAGLCNIPLQPTRYRAGTSTISSDTESKVSRVYSTFKYTPVVVEEVVEAEPSYAVYDDTTTITATYLLDKIRRTKRQRGDCLYGNIHLPYTSTSSTVNSARSAAVASVGVYSAPHVHALSAVVAKSNDYYWNSTKVTQKAKKAVPAKSVNEPITMAQYARNIHTGTGGNSIVLSSCSNGSSITNHTLKRYAQPLELTNAHLPLCDVSNRNVFAAATTTTNTTNSSTNNTTTNNGSVVLSIPDLTLNTREIAWTEIASEFAILPAPTEEGSIGFGYSASTAALDSVISVVPVKTEKKRKYLNNHEKLKTSGGKGGVGGTSGASGSGSVSAASLAMEVLAPQFVEIVPAHVLVEQMKAQQQAPPSPSSTSFSTSQEQEGQEDLSDEAFAARHEATLQAMRDKWTRLQQLKNDALYGAGNGPEVKQYRGGGYGGYFNRATAGAGGKGELNLTSPGLDNANKFANLSPRKRGLASAHAKRRGRPPKNAKFHNNLHNHSASAALASNSVGNTDGENMEVDD